MANPQEEAQKARIEESRVERIRRILALYEIDPDNAVWQVHGKAVIYHTALERIATKAQITFDPPLIVRAEKDEAVLVVTGRMGGKVEWATGEALLNANYKIRGGQSPYVWAMAEKRGKDRVILKLIELHGDLYSEEEADDVKQQFDAEKAAQALMNEIDRQTTHAGIESLMKSRAAMDDLAKMSREVQQHITSYAKDAYRYLRSRAQRGGGQGSTTAQTMGNGFGQRSQRDEWATSRQIGEQARSRLPENASDRREPERRDGGGFSEGHKPPDEILAELREQLMYCHTVQEVNATTDDFKDAIGKLTPPDIATANAIRTARLKEIEQQERVGS